MAVSCESTSVKLHFSLVLPCPNFVLKKWILRQQKMALAIKTQVLPMNPSLKAHVRLWGLHCYAHSWWQLMMLLPDSPPPITILYTKSIPFMYSAWSSLNEVWLVLIPALLWRRALSWWQPAQRLLLVAHNAKGAMQCGDFLKIYEQNYKSVIFLHRVI